MHESSRATRKRSVGALEDTVARVFPSGERGRKDTFPAVAIALGPRRVQARVACALGFDGFDRGRDQVIGNVGTGDPLANEHFTLVLGLNANVHKARVCQHPFQVVQE